MHKRLAKKSMRLAKKGDFDYHKRYENYGTPARTSTVSARGNNPHIS
jgi:hypothetical protein